MILLQSEAVGAFALVEDVGSKLPTLYVSHCVMLVVTLSWCVRHCWAHSLQVAAARRGARGRLGQAGPGWAAG